MRRGLRGYFFLGNFLPPLQYGAQPQLSFSALSALFEENLAAPDLERVAALRSFVDLTNVPKLLKGEALDSRGNFSEKELDEAFVNREKLPDYLFEADGDEEIAPDFAQVLLTFLREMEGRERGFLKRYFRFEWEWRALLSIFRSRRLERGAPEMLSANSFSDFTLSEALSQSQALQFAFPFDYRDLGERVEEALGDPMEEYRAVNRYRFDWIKEQVEGSPFSLEYLLGYAAQLMIVEDAASLSSERGSARLDEIIRGDDE